MPRRLLDRPEIVSHDIVTRAMHRAGTDDFGGTAWTEPLEVLTRSLDREALLSLPGRRRARLDLVGRLVARTLAPAEPGGRPVALVTAPDSDCLEAIERALGSRVGRGAALLESSFTSQTFEVRWHLPSYAEWLAEADLAPVYRDAAERSARLADDAPVEVVGAVEFGERRAELETAFPGALFVEVTRDLDEAVATTTTDSAATRRSSSSDVDVGKVERYWRWRLGLRAERLAAGRPADVTVAYDELLTSPALVASRVFDAAGVSPPR